LLRITKSSLLLKQTVLTDDEILAKLKTLDRNILINVALCVDTYDFEHSMFKRMGGLHDYAFSLTEDQLYKAILSYVNKWPELRKDGKVEEIMTRQQNLLVGATYGGIEDYLYKFDVADLKKLALAGESYDRSKRGVVLLGGLHDYIDSLSKDQVYDIIMKYVSQYPELRTVGTLESLAKIPQEGFNTMFEKYTIEDLKKTCLALEKFDRDVRNIVLMGGLHDYIDSLKKEDLVGYIRKTAESYPEIRNLDALKKIVEKYSK